MARGRRIQQSASKLECRLQSRHRREGEQQRDGHNVREGWARDIASAETESANRSYDEDRWCNDALYPSRSDWTPDNADGGMWIMSRMRPRIKQQVNLMLEVMIALFIVLLGLIGLARLQARAQQVETESYQRVQALMLLRDLADRINADRSLAASYVTASLPIASGPLGTGGTSNIDCSAPTTTPAVDLCQWHQALLGAAE